MKCVHSVTNGCSELCGCIDIGGVIPEGFVRSDEVEALVFPVSDRRSSSFDQRDADSVTKTLQTERKVNNLQVQQTSPETTWRRKKKKCHLFALVEPDLLRVDGGVHFRFGPFQLEDAVSLTVRSGTEAPPAEHQLISDVLLQRAHPAPPQH